MNRWLKALCVGLAVSAVLSLCGFSRECGLIRESVLRLHVLANSDSEADQALKLRVRDRVLQEAESLFEAASDRQAAEAVAAAHLDGLEQAAREEIAAAGYNYPVRVELCRMYFDTREYEAGRFPAGVYPALRVIIGEGQGKNWWCVAFPPICTGAAADLSGVLTEGQQELVEHPDGYRVGFKVVEWVETIASWWA